MRKPLRWRPVSVKKEVRHLQVGDRFYDYDKHTRYSVLGVTVDEHYTRLKFSSLSASRYEIYDASVQSGMEFDVWELMNPEDMVSAHIASKEPV